MKKQVLLPLLMGAVIGTQVLLKEAPVVYQQAHTALNHLFKGSIITSAYADEAAAVKYTCPMHPQIISDRPGQCPICGMNLVAIEHQHEMSQPAGAETSVGQAQSGRKVLYWYDPMVPGKKFDKPGKSPFMDMELVPKYAEEMDAKGENGKPVISISADNVQKMGVRTERVTKSSFGQDIRATGIVMENERARVDIFSQVEGRVEGLHSAVGDRVKKGEIFYTLAASPELTGLQSDYLAALSGGLKEMASATRKRMKLLGIDDLVLDTLAKTRKPYDQVPFYIPADGILYRLEIRNGHYLKAGDEIGHIQDLSVVWVEASVPEKDIAVINPGDDAQVLLTGNAQKCSAKVDYIYPDINMESRTAKVRLIVQNSDGILKPASYVTVIFATGVAERITVPSEAVLRSAEGDHVIISLGNGKFQSRKIETGVVSEGRTEILSGLHEGETVVTSSQFLIDSESNLRDSLNKMSAPDMDIPQQSTPPKDKGMDMKEGE